MKGERKQQLVTVKGTKDGITLHLNDTCAYEDLLEEIDTLLSESHLDNSDNPLFSVRMKLGNRFLTEEQEKEIRNLVQDKRNLVIEALETEVVSVSEALEWIRNNEITSVAQTVRSGQVVHVQGDLLLIGDVNAGGTVTAGGNIFIMGALRGIAHAGYNGNKEAVIAASLMKPMQLRIHDVMNRAPDGMHLEEGNEMECAYINGENMIVVDDIRSLKAVRPNLTRLERRV